MNFKTWSAVEEELGRETFAHEIIYYIPTRMTLQQWSDLDDAMSDALVKVLGEDHEVVGFAGPIPFEN